MKHFLSVDELSNVEIMSLIQTAEKYLQGYYQPINEQIFAANLFFEASTRTKMSFVVAERKLGLEVLDFHSDSSSMKKGETLYDTAKTFAAIGANLLIIRHEDDQWFNELSNSLAIPMINAGAGKGEHPTQCLLDLMTIYQEYGTFKNLNVAIIGDIKHSRVARSNAKALTKLGANVFFSAAPVFVEESLQHPYISIDEAVNTCDVVMLLRIQHERHTMTTREEDYLEKYGLTIEREQLMKKTAIILHPAPINRGVEIDSNLVECERSRIFKQMTNGVYMRMAIISKILTEWGIANENLFEERSTIITG